jgi:hypothetical protein
MSVPAGPQDSSACDRASRRRVTDLVAACRRHGVAMGLLTCGNRRAMEAVARRAQLPMLEQDDALAVIRVRQRAGARVGRRGCLACPRCRRLGCLRCRGCLSWTARDRLQAGLHRPTNPRTTASVVAGFTSCSPQPGWPRRARRQGLGLFG